MLLHPGGPKILEVAEEGLNLTREHTQYSWAVLKERGNMSGCTAMQVRNCSSLLAF